MFQMRECGDCIYGQASALHNVSAHTIMRLK